MFSMLEFVMVACLFADLVVTRGTQLLSLVKGAEATVVAEVKTVVDDVKKSV
jgi:hypothetical protein